MRTATALLLLLILAACGSGYKGPAGRSPKVAFCDLYRRDAGDGRLRNWDLNDNAKTASATFLCSPRSTTSYLHPVRACSRTSTTPVESTLRRLLLETQPLRNPRPSS